MSALPRQPRDMGYVGLRMTADEYLSLGETQERYELIDGVVFMSPSPTPWHQKLKQLILRQIMDSVPGAEAFLDTDVRFSPALVYCPDISVYRPGRLARVPERLTEPPDLIVEVLSPGNKPLDLITKRHDYERFGVGEYWVIDPTTTEIRRFVRRAQRFEDAPVEGDTIACESIPGLTIDVRPLRGT